MRQQQWQVPLPRAAAAAPSLPFGAGTAHVRNGKKKEHGVPHVLDAVFLLFTRARQSSGSAPKLAFLLTPPKEKGQWLPGLFSPEEAMPPAALGCLRSQRKRGWSSSWGMCLPQGDLEALVSSLSLKEEN